MRLLRLAICVTSLGCAGLTGNDPAGDEDLRRRHAAPAPDLGGSASPDLAGTPDLATGQDAGPAPPSCGNGVADPGEACDGTDLAGYTCAGNFAGYTGGTLRCRPDCLGFDLSACVAGATHAAASCNLADVRNAVAAAAPGDIVTIPAGTCPWTGTLNVSKPIVLRGAGIDGSSRLQNGGVYPMVAIGDHVRVTNIYFDGVNWDPPDSQNLRTAVWGGGHGARVDHCVFDKGVKQMVWAGGLSDGLIDHNDFRNPNIALTRTDVVTAGNAAWAAPIVPGTTNALVFEKNTFTYDWGDPNQWWAGSMITHDEANASRTTIRYNSFNVPVAQEVDGAIEAHGNQGYAPASRGAVMLEIYGNDFNMHNGYRFMNARAGSWLVWGNHFNYGGSRPAAITLTEEEAWQTEFFSPLRTTWSAQDQLNNSFFWNNTMNGSAHVAGDYQIWQTGVDTFIQQDRDWFLHAPCDGTGGCTGGKIVWTDPTQPGIAGNETWIKTGANAFYPYVPLVYPHPLAVP